MKKISFAIIMMGFAGVVGATEIQGGVAIDSTACSILSDRVTVNISAGVTAAYNCDTTANVIRVGTCHSAGSVKPTTVRCVGTEVIGEDGATSTTYNDSTCTGAADQSFSIQGRRVFTGRSTGGGVASGSLDSTTCNVAAVDAKITN